MKSSHETKWDAYRALKTFYKFVESRRRFSNPMRDIKTPHRLRHAFGKNFLVQGGDLRSLQEIMERAEKIISRMVVGGADVTEEQAAKIYERELKKLSRKFTHMRYHSFLMYFGVLKRLGWVKATDQTQPSAIQENYPPAPERTYYRLTQKGGR